MNSTTTTTSSSTGHGLTRMLRSMKFYTALTGSILLLTPIFMNWSSMTAQERSQAIQDSETKLAAMWVSVIVLSGGEDIASSLSGSPSPGTTTTSQTVTPASTATTAKPLVIPGSKALS